MRKQTLTKKCAIAASDCTIDCTNPNLSSPFLVISSAQHYPIRLKIQGPQKRGRIRSQTLYPAELRARNNEILPYARVIIHVQEYPGRASAQSWLALWALLRARIFDDLAAAGGA